jgi:hypothetical protein
MNDFLKTVYNKEQFRHLNITSGRVSKLGKANFKLEMNFKIIKGGSPLSHVPLSMFKMEAENFVGFYG